MSDRRHDVPTIESVERESRVPPVRPPSADEPPVSAPPVREPDSAEKRAVAPPAAEPPLTAKCWSLWAAIAITALTAALTLGAGLLTAWLSQARAFENLAANAQALIGGAVLIGAYGLLVGVIWLSARSSSLTLAAAVGLRRVRVGPTLAIAVGIALAARLLTGLYAALLQTLGVNSPGPSVDPTRLLPSSALGVVLTIVLACVAAPIAEEMVFRGVLLPALDARWGATFAIIGSSAVFAAMHVLPFAIPPIFVLALLLGRVFIRSRSLWVSIASHAMFNFIGIVAVYALKWTGVL